MQEERRRSVDVVGAVIERSGTVLCARRGPGGETGGLWEFPGGKVEPGETPEDALRREIAEELGCRVRVAGPVATTRHPYAHADIVLTTFWCELTSGEPRAGEHAEIAWVRPDELAGLAWAPADVPAAQAVAAALGDVARRE